MNITKKREKEKFSLFNSLYPNFLADATVKLYSFLKWNFIIIYKAVDASFYRLQRDIMLLEPKKAETTLKVISISMARNFAHGRQKNQRHKYCGLIFSFFLIREVLQNSNIFQSNYFLQLFTMIHFYITLER